MGRIAASQAYECSLRNGSAKWPSRGDGERLWPMCQPEFTPSFRIERGESIFTIGSCFARNIEYALVRNGMRAPCLGFEAPEGESYHKEAPSILNKFTPGGMLNEVRYALTDWRPSFGVASDGGILDLQLHTNTPVTEERYEQRRQDIARLYRSAIAESRVTVITLGLAEAWWDKEAGIYLNNTPTRKVILDYPERFEFEVLPFSRCMEDVTRLLALLRGARADMKVILTVSPVPLARTFTGMDVISANTHSKAVLRTVAGEVAASHDFVDYFPSFESVSNSNPESAWLDDLRHPTPAIVNQNVGRMIEAYIA